MPIWLYFGLWMLAALILVGFISAGIAKHLHLREARRQQGVLLLDALERYADWVVAQRHAPVFDGESSEAAAALDQAGLIRTGWFPELAGDLAELLGVHARLMHFLSSQHALRQRDPDAWIETDHDGRFLSLWRQQATLLQAIKARLATIGVASPADQVVNSLASAMRESNA